MNQRTGATRFHLIRHALVDPSFHGVHYGVMDVPLCGATLAQQVPLYAGLARRLPPGARWVVTPLARTTQTAQAIFAAGYPQMPLEVEPGLLEQDIGAWHGLRHDSLGALLSRPPGPFWPMAVDEVPPGGESMLSVSARVAAVLERMAVAHAGDDVVIVSHGGAIRAAVVHALGVSPEHGFRMAVDNLSLSELAHDADGWRVMCLNQLLPAAGEPRR